VCARRADLGERLEREREVLLALEPVDREEDRLLAARAPFVSSASAPEAHQTVEGGRTTYLTSHLSFSPTCVSAPSLAPALPSSTAGYTTLGRLLSCANVRSNTLAVNSELTRILSASPVVAISTASIGARYVLRISPANEKGVPARGSRGMVGRLRAEVEGDRRRSGKWQ